MMPGKQPYDNIHINSNMSEGIRVDQTAWVKTYKNQIK